MTVPESTSTRPVYRRYEPPTGQAKPAPAALLDSFSYDDAIVRKFLTATFIWGLVGMLVGLVIALQLAWPAARRSPAAKSPRVGHTADPVVATAGRTVGDGTPDPIPLVLPGTRAGPTYFLTPPVSPPTDPPPMPSSPAGSSRTAPRRS